MVVTPLPPPVCLPAKLLLSPTLGACRWLHTLVQLAPKQLLPHTAALLREVLPCLGHEGRCWRHLLLPGARLAPLPWPPAPPTTLPSHPALRSRCRHQHQRRGPPGQQRPPGAAAAAAAAATRRQRSGGRCGRRRQRPGQPGPSGDRQVAHAALPPPCCCRCSRPPEHPVVCRWLFAHAIMRDLGLPFSHALPCTSAALPCPPRSKQLEGEAEVSKLEALQWVHALLSRDARLLEDQQQLLLAALCDALAAASGAPRRCRVPRCASPRSSSAGLAAFLGAAAGLRPSRRLLHLEACPDPRAAPRTLVPLRPSGDRVTDGAGVCGGAAGPLPGRHRGPAGLLPRRQRRAPAPGAAWALAWTGTDAPASLSSLGAGRLAPRCNQGARDRQAWFQCVLRPAPCLQRRGGLIIQQLSQRLGGLRVYKELSRLLQASSRCRRWLPVIPLELVLCMLCMRFAAGAALWVNAMRGCCHPACPCLRVPVLADQRSQHAARASALAGCRRRRMWALRGPWCRPSTSSCSPAASCRRAALQGGPGRQYACTRQQRHRCLFVGPAGTAHGPSLPPAHGLLPPNRPRPAPAPVSPLRGAGAAGAAAEQPAVFGGRRRLHPALLLLELQLRRLAGAGAAGAGALFGWAGCRMAGRS